MLASAESLEGVFSVIGNGGIDVNSIDLRIGQQRVVIRVALGNAKLVPNLIQRIRIALTERHNVRIRVTLINGNKLGTKAETDDGDAGMLD